MTARTAALAAILWMAPAQEGPGPVVRVAPSALDTRVPSVLRQGAFLAPQAVSSVEVLEDGRVAVSTMAFRHDRNFWVLSAGGQPLWSRQDPQGRVRRRCRHWIPKPPPGTSSF